MPSRTIAIGDIHGCFHAFEALLNALSPTADDCLVLLGDYVDRGPDSCRVIQRILELERHCTLVPLLGNHEVMLLEALKSLEWLVPWLGYGGQQTMDSYGGDPSQIPPGHLDFMRACRPYFETETHLFVHANYEPDLPLDQQPEETLLWSHLTLRLPPPHTSGKRAVVGHTPQVNGEILDLGHLVCIDTYCYGSGWLTALDVDSGQTVQADRQGQVRSA
jgi:serine/threonine protein phosphatase 1